MTRATCNPGELLSPSPRYSGERAGERGWAEGKASLNLRASLRSCPSPQPSPRSTGEREFRSCATLIAVLLLLVVVAPVGAAQPHRVSPHAKFAPVALSESRWAGGLMGER